MFTTLMRQSQHEHVTIVLRRCSYMSASVTAATCSGRSTPAPVTTRVVSDARAASVAESAALRLPTSHARRFFVVW